jgi:hypothetical protein
MVENQSENGKKEEKQISLSEKTFTSEIGNYFHRQIPPKIRKNLLGK